MSFCFMYVNLGRRPELSTAYASARSFSPNFLTRLCFMFQYSRDFWAADVRDAGSGLRATGCHCRCHCRSVWQETAGNGIFDEPSRGLLSLLLTSSTWSYRRVASRRSAQLEVGALITSHAPEMKNSAVVPNPVRNYTRAECRAPEQSKANSMHMLCIPSTRVLRGRTFLFIFFAAHFFFFPWRAAWQAITSRSQPWRWWSARELYSAEQIGGEKKKKIPTCGEEKILFFFYSSGLDFWTFLTELFSQMRFTS